MINRRKLIQVAATTAIACLITPTKAEETKSKNNLFFERQNPLQEIHFVNSWGMDITEYFTYQNNKLLYVQATPFNGKTYYVADYVNDWTLQTVQKQREMSERA